MARKSWKKVVAVSLPHAMELCLDYAKSVRNVGVDRIADQMGISSRWTVYKWIESGRIPAILIRPFEAACGINLITRYLAQTDNKLLVNIPTGKQANAKQVNELQTSLNTAISLLLNFAEGKTTENETVQSLLTAMENLAYHKKNVEKSKQPELDFFGGE
jgi:hypothetical protein